MLFLKQINPNMEEAALLYCSWECVVKKITLRLIAPALFFSFILVFMLSFGELSVANFLRYDIFPKESFTQFSAFYDFKVATITAMPMLFLAVLLILFEKYVVKQPLQFSASYHTLKIDLKKKRKPLMFFMLFFISIIILLPLSSLLMQVDAKSFLLALNKAIPVLRRSVLFAFFGATLLLIFGFLSAYTVVQKRMGAHLFTTITLLLFILPSTLIGIALILFYNTSYTNFIYATPLIIIFGYTIKYLFLSSKIIEKKLIQIPHSLIDAAKLSGASKSQIVWFILLPLVKDALILAWVVGFIFSLRESSITMLVYPAGSDTLPLYIFTQMANGDPKIIASLSLIMILIVILPLSIYFLQRQLRR
jgi:iron(III) transport system permease protein